MQMNVLVFDPSAKGAATSIRKIAGPSTGIAYDVTISVDAAKNVINGTFATREARSSLRFCRVNQARPNFGSEREVCQK
jgi:hypothetical protein